MSKNKFKNQPKEYVDTITVECSRLQATESTKDDNSKWRNSLGNGIQVKPGDSIEVSSAFLNANGAGDGVNSICFDGKKIGKYTETGLWTDENYNFDGVHENDVFDNKTQIKINFYKNNDGLNCLQLPLTTFNKVYQDNPTTVSDFDDHNSTNRYVPIQTSTNDTGHFNEQYVLPEYKRVFDGSRFTIYKRDKGKDHLTLNEFDKNEPGYFMWYEYEKFIELETDKGFNNCNNVAQDITLQLNKITNEYYLDGIPKKQISATNFTLEKSADNLPDATGKFNNQSIIKETATFKAFQCATRYTTCENAFTDFYIEGTHFNVYLRNFDFVATKYANFRNAGLKLGNRWSSDDGVDCPFIRETITNPVTNQWIEVSEQFWNEKENYFKWFDTQQREDGLLSKINYTASERFVHISVSDGYTQRIGSDLKFMELSHLCKVHFDLNYYGIETEASKAKPWKGFLAQRGNPNFYQYCFKIKYSN